MSHAPLVIPNSQVLPLVRDVELASLDSLKLSPRLPIQEDLDVWITIPGIKTRNGLFMSDAERVLDAFKCSSASSIVALERCYTLFLLLLTHQ